jgi:hypothetical protein
VSEQVDESGAGDVDGRIGATARARRNARFIWSMVRLQPKLFAIAVSGAAVFALLTVASSFAISWVIDNVVVPRFEDGEVATATVLAGLGTRHRHRGGSGGGDRDPAQRSLRSRMWRVAQIYSNRWSIGTSTSR